MLQLKKFLSQYHNHRKEFVLYRTGVNSDHKKSFYKNSLLSLRIFQLFYIFESEIFLWILTFIRLK